MKNPLERKEIIMRRNRILALGLVLALLCSCKPKTPEPAPTAEPTPTPAAEPTATPAPEPVEVNVAMLKGPTGLGAAKLMEDDGMNRLSGLNRYGFLPCADPTETVALLTKGEADIAALPTNMASILYHKTDGDIQLLALNTYGVLYILENGDRIQSVADLEGRTVHAFGQGANPEFVLNYLLEQNGVDLDSVDMQWHASTDEVVALMAAGEADACMLPVPASTALLMQNENVREALDLTEEWDKAGGDGVLTMGCVVVRTEFAQENRGAVETFLREYRASIDYMTDPDNLSDAALLAEKQGIVPKAAVAERAIPAANLCFVVGNDMMDGIQGYYQVLFRADPASIGGSIPDGAFYYMPPTSLTQLRAQGVDTFQVQIEYSGAK